MIKELLNQLHDRLTENNPQVNLHPVESILFPQLMACIQSSKFEDFSSFLVFNKVLLEKYGIKINVDSLHDKEIGIYSNSFGQLYDSSIAIVFNTKHIDPIECDDNSTLFIGHEGCAIMQDYATATGYHSTSITAFNCASVILYDKSVVYLRDNAYYKAFDKAIVITAENSHGIATEDVIVTSVPSQIKDILTERNLSVIENE